MTTSAILGSPSFFGPSLSALSRASTDVSLSAERLASGNRLVRASDDVAALSISSRLASQVSALKVAQNNASQGTSFLQVGSDALGSIREILDRMQALAVQADSGALTDSDRGLLQQEFTELTDEIDRIAENTAFGSINLLNGTLTSRSGFSTVSTQATQASGSFTFTDNPANNETIVLNGVTFTAKTVAATSTEFTIGGTAAASATAFAAVLNASTNTAISQATYEADGATITITQDAGGTLGNQYLIDNVTSTADLTVSAANTQVTDLHTLQNGANDGLRSRSVVATGSIGDALVNTQSQSAAFVTLTISGTVSNGETLTIDNGNGGVVTFTFATAAVAATDIQIGADTEETLENTIETLKSYTATNNYGVRQLDFSLSGSVLTIRNQNIGDPADFAGADLDIGETLANGALSAASFGNGVNTGVNTSGVINAEFTGTVGGFSATYNSADDITASITVGSHTYTAEIDDTTPASNTFVRFNSAEGGYFDVQLAAGGLAVGSQGAADTYASRLDDAFSTLTFHQSRNVSSFEGSGTLAGGASEAQFQDFTNLLFGGAEVTAPASPGGDAEITITLTDAGGNEEVFSSAAGLGGSLGAYETITLTSADDSNRVIRITGGDTAVDFSDAAAAATFETDLNTSFGLSGAALDFRVGPESSDIINVDIGDARSATLFSGAEPNLSTQSAASEAQDILDGAIDRVSEIMADLGAFQSRFETAYDNLDSWRLNVDQARAQLADTDIPQESTNFATSILRANAASAVIAQVIGLQSSMLDVLRAKAA